MSKLKVERVGELEDADGDVYKVRISGCNSYLTFCLDNDEGCIRVFTVVSVSNGHMKAMLDSLVSNLGVGEVWFMNPLKFGDTNLEDRLHGFELVEEEVPDDHQLDVDSVEVLKGEWVVERDS